MPTKSLKVPAPKPGVPVPKLVSSAAKILTARATGTRLQSIPNVARVPALSAPRAAPKIARAIAPGAMPRKTFVSPKVAVPMRPRAPGANAVNPTVFDRLTRGRILQRGTR